MTKPPTHLESLPDLLAGRPCVLVTGSRSFNASGAAARLAHVIDLRATPRFARATGKPSPEDAARVADLCTHNPDAVVVAIGGGAVMDLAKAGAALAATSAPADALLDAGLPESFACAPIIAVPTTFGSGSEATRFAVLYTAEANRVLAHEALVPEACILDAALGASVPPLEGAAACFDALAQAIEAHWSTRSNDASLAWSSEAMHALVPVVEAAAMELDPDALCTQAYGSWLAGRAINTAFTTAGHALSYGFTIQHDVPHGAAVAMVLPGVADHLAGIQDADATDDRGAAWTMSRLQEIADALGVTNVADIGRWLEGLRDRLQLPAGVATADPARLATTVDPQRLATTPRVFSADVVESIQASVRDAA